MITLTLLHPIQSIPVQSWSFEHESVIRIGRSTDNHVILYSAVVSRHHVELRQVDSHWEIINLGANGTYLDGKRITQVPVVDGVVIRLARSGPNIQIHIGTSASGASDAFTGEKTLAQRIISRPDSNPAEKQAVAPLAGEVNEVSVPPTHQPDLHQPDLLEQRMEGEMAAEAEKGVETGIEAGVEEKGVTGETLGGEGVDLSPAQPSAVVEVENAQSHNPEAPLTTPEAAPVQPADEAQLFCQDSGQPLQVLQSVVEYQIVKTLQEEGVSLTQVAWRNGQSLLLKTLNSEWVNHPKSLELFEQEAKLLQQLSHPGLPRFVDYFQANQHPYLAVEWVHGDDLHQWVASRGPLSLEDAIAATLQLCDVLNYLHQQDPPYIHQDIRPENLIWRSSTFATNTIAVVGIPSLKKLETSTHPGAVGYSAPEQQQGLPVPASDLYALGATLVYLLTGKEPGEFYAQREQGFRLYPEYVPGLPAALVPIIRKLTNPQPEERYATAKEVAEVLSLVEEDEEKVTHK